jgi:hypothetical protein
MNPALTRREDRQRRGHVPALAAEVEAAVEDAEAT